MSNDPRLPTTTLDHAPELIFSASGLGTKNFDRGKDNYLAPPPLEVEPEILEKITREDGVRWWHDGYTASVPGFH